ncbi:MAG: GNAT family N-acetyltransferase [Gammaproteobacteria bacterium]|nr:GNAT family N-acetyltransferase [Gammaproteobacteria bacterium]
MQDVRRRVARVFVASEDDSTSINGYYTLSASSIERELLASDEAKRRPHYPVPTILIGRFAVDVRSQGRGLGETLLMDAVNRVIRASEAVAVYAIIVDAKNDDAFYFYQRYGFISSQTMPNRLYLPLDSLRKLNLDTS